MSDPCRLSTEFGLFPLTREETSTVESMLGPEQTKITLMPTHHINGLGDMMGFKFECASFLPGSCVPLVRTMFHGHTLVECQASEDQIMRLMSQPDVNRQLMLEFLRGLDEECVPAGLECIPENASAVTASGMVQATGLRSVDSKHWTPEVPERIGLYHAYIRGFNRDVRSHRLFIVCSGGMNKASDAFCNLVIDVGAKSTAWEVCESEEAWWLRKGCQRARCRLIKQLADVYGVALTHIQDIQSYHASNMAIPTSDTLEHNMTLSDGKVTVHNACTDTTKNMNGIVCSMHPSEGVWLFRGANRGGGFGSMFGDKAVCGAFPVTSPRVKRAESISVQDSSCVVRLRSRASKEGYMCFDEAFFKTLERMQWNRDNGYVELIPIVVGLN